MWASPRVGAGPADCLGGGAATWAPPSTRRSSQESDVTSIDVAGRVTGGCRRRTTRKVLVDAQARACAVAGAGLRATPRFSGCCPGFETKIGGFARPTCRKFGGDLPRHRRDVLRLRCEGMGLRATSERRDLVSAAEQAGGARCEATTSGGRGVRTASAVTVSRFPWSLSLSALRPARPFRRDTHTPTSQVHGPSLSAGIGPVGSVGRPTAVLGFASAFWGVLAAPRTAHRRRRWGKLTRNSRSVVVTTAIPMENLTRPCIADSRGAVFERRQPIL